MLAMSSLLNQLEAPDNNHDPSRNSSASNVTSPPSYVSHAGGRNEGHSYATGGDRRDESVSGRRSGTSSTPSISDTDTLADLQDVTETSLVDTEVSSPLDLQYLYYRVYAEDGPIRSMQPLNADDPSLSRIYARSVAPPHTVALLKSRFCNVEDVFGGTTLYVTVSSPTPMDNGERILLNTDTRPGLTAQYPMAFVVKSLDAERKALPTADSPTVDALPPETRYVYYRVYTAGGEIPSKQPVGQNDRSLGRIRTDFIPPPRTVASMRKAISRAEKFPSSWNAKLFVNMFSESPMDEAHDPNLTSDFPFSLDQPLAFVLQIHVFKANDSYDYSPSDRSFLRLVKGETYYSNGVVQRAYHRGDYYDAYQAVTPAGDVGCEFRPPMFYDTCMPLMSPMVASGFFQQSRQGIRRCGILRFVWESSEMTNPGGGHVEGSRYDEFREEITHRAPCMPRLVTMSPPVYTHIQCSHNSFANNFPPGFSSRDVVVKFIEGCALASFRTIKL